MNDKLYPEIKVGNLVDDGENLYLVIAFWYNGVPKLKQVDRATYQPKK